jgi:hypothetical protein
MVRHRTPAIFSIYMVDVLCCALGCVILLWQLYHSESEQQTAAAKSALDKLAQANVDLSNVTGERDEARSERDSEKERRIQVTLELNEKTRLLDEKTRLALVRSEELEALRKTYAAAQAALASLNIDYAKIKTDHADLSKKDKLTSEELAAKIKAYAEVLATKVALDKRMEIIEKELRLKAIEAKFATEKADSSAKAVEDAETRAKRLEKLYAGLLATSKGDLAKLTVSEKQIKALEDELAKSGKKIDELISLRDLLAARVLASTKDIASLKEKVERRFEGISLEGKKICFLIDISGSMVMRDSKTNDPEKWAKVVATIERVAGSLADAESYQVILFSTDVNYLFKGTKREWLPFDKATSPKKIGDALRAVKPEGGTNLYAGLEEAFELRRKGLESLYVFSDGLPTEGPGLSDADARLSDALQSERLGRIIRNRLMTLWNPPILGRRVSINAIGFYFDSPDVGAFLWSLARENDGSFVGMSRP